MIRFRGWIARGSVIVLAAIWLVVPLEFVPEWLIYMLLGGLIWHHLGPALDRWLIDAAGD